MSASLVMGIAVMPVSSRTSRRAVWSGFSPGSTRPFGKANNTFCDFDRAPGEGGAASFWGSITATYQAFSRRLSTTPPAEISRTIAHNLAGLGQLVMESGAGPGG